MVRAFLILGAALDILFALLLLLVIGWIMDSWRDLIADIPHQSKRNPSLIARMPAC